MAFEFVFRPMLKLQINHKFHIFKQVLAHFLRAVFQYLETRLFAQKLVPTLVFPVTAQTENRYRQRSASLVFHLNIIKIRGIQSQRLWMQAAIFNQNFIAQMMKLVNKNSGIIMTNFTNFAISVIQGGIANQSLVFEHFAQNIFQQHVVRFFF